MQKFSGKKITLLSYEYVEIWGSNPAYIQNQLVLMIKSNYHGANVIGSDFIVFFYKKKLGILNFKPHSFHFLTENSFIYIF